MLRLIFRQGNGIGLLPDLRIFHNRFLRLFILLLFVCIAGFLRRFLHCTVLLIFVRILRAAVLVLRIGCLFVRRLPRALTIFFSIRRFLRALIGIFGFPVIRILILIRGILTGLYRGFQCIGQRQLFQPRPHGNGLFPDPFRQVRKAGHIKDVLLCSVFRRKDRKCLQYIRISRKQYAQT